MVNSVGHCISWFCMHSRCYFVLIVVDLLLVLLDVLWLVLSCGGFDGGLGLLFSAFGLIL